MSIATLNDIFFAAVERNLDRALLYREGQEWKAISSREFGRRVARTARMLHDWGIQAGDRVCILSENRPEWPIADVASLLLGAVTVPLYTTLTADQTAFALRDSGCRVIFLSSETQLRKVLSVLSQTQIERIVVMDPVVFADDISAYASRCTAMSGITGSGLNELDPELDARARAVRPDDLATIVYTSGTTGASKGAMLTHGNIASNIQCSLLGFDMQPGLVSVSFLPLCHITARHLDFAMLNHGVTLAYCPFLDQLPASLLQVKPNVFVAVPRVYASRAKNEKPSQARHLRVGAWSRQGAQARNSGWAHSHFPHMEAGQQARVFEDPRGPRGTSSDFHLRRSAAGPRVGRMVCQCRHPHSRRLWPY
jgi:long-chain acyl-CoA synthetase